MKGLIKIIGTNDATKLLMGLEFKDSSLLHNGKLHTCLLNGRGYLLDIKQTTNYDTHLMIHGMISDDENFAGNIALEFYPSK